MRISATETARPALAIAGAAGRMGREVVAAAVDQGFTVAGATETPEAGVFCEDVGHLAGRKPIGVYPVAHPGDAGAQADAWIDFTRPAATLVALEALRATPVRAVIIGTTGFSPAGETAIAAAAKRYAIVKTGNFSIGVNLLEALVRLAASRLGADWDIEILETHHSGKVDAPSGTALMLGEAAARGRNTSLEMLRSGPYAGTDSARQQGRIGFAVRRAGGIVGEHEVLFGAAREVLRLNHTALDRSVFAYGALRAAAWAVDQPPGLYTLHDVLALGNTPAHLPE